MLDLKNNKNVVFTKRYIHRQPDGPTNLIDMDPEELKEMPSYVINCLIEAQNCNGIAIQPVDIQGKKSDFNYLFKEIVHPLDGPMVIARLDGYAIIPLQEYYRMKDQLRKVSNG